MIKTFKGKSWLALAALPVLAACGGGTTTTSSEPFTVLGTTITGTETVAVLSLDTGTSTTASTSGTYNYTTDKVTVSSTDYSTDGSSVVSNDQSSGRYSYVAGLAGTSDYKLFALQTSADDLPSNVTVVYEGQGFVVVTANSATFEGAVESTITANFGTTGNTVDVLLDSLASDATKNGVAMVPADFTGAERIEFNDLVISGAGYTEGAGSSVVIHGFGLATTSNTTGATIDVTGVFAGDTGTETAGVGVIDQGGTGDEAFVSFSGTSD